MTEGDGEETLKDGGTLRFIDLDDKEDVTLTSSLNASPVWSAGGALPAGLAEALTAGFSVSEDASGPNATGSWAYTEIADLDFLR